METKRLKQFCAIIETGSLVKASELLHITHSALSKSMRILQDETGLTLLRPSGRGVVATEEGLIIYHRAKEFLEHENGLFKLDKKIAPSPIKLGVAEIFISPMIQQIKKHALDNSSVSLLEADPENMEMMIANRQLDYGVTYAPFPMDNIEIIELGKFRSGCYFLKGTFEGKDLSEIPFVVPAQTLSNNPLDIKSRDGWLQNSDPRNKKYAVNLLSTAIELTLHGLCAIYIPDFIAKKINQSRNKKECLIEYPLPTTQKNTQRVFLLTHKDQRKDATFKKIHNIAKQMIRSPDETFLVSSGINIISPNKKKHFIRAT